MEVLASLTLVTNFFCHVHTCCAVLWPWKCMLSAKFPINACGPGFSRISSHWTVSLDSLAANTLSALHCIPLAWTVSLTSTAVCLWLYLTAIGVHGNQFSSVAQSYPTLQPYGLQHTRLPCPSPTPRAYSNSCPSRQWYHPTTLSSVFPFSHLQSFPASGSFPISQFFTSGGQSIGVSASARVLPMNIQDWFPSGLTGWISLQSKGLWRVFFNTTVQNHQFFGAQLSL